jgi:hypothetical protein
MRYETGRGFSFQRHFDVDGYGTKCPSETLVREISTMVNAEKEHRFWNALALVARGGL